MRKTNPSDYKNDVDLGMFISAEDTFFVAWRWWLISEVKYLCKNLKVKWERAYFWEDTVYACRCKAHTLQSSSSS